MKSIKLIFLLSIFSVFVFYSCNGDDEPIDPLLLVEEPTACSQPAFFNVSSFINGNTVRIEWDKTSGDEWEVQYGTNGFVLGSGTTANFISTSSLISGLTATTDYDFYIRTKCSNDDYSEWIGPIAPGSSVDVCVNPANLTAVRSATDETKITATWSANGDETSWQVQYGTSGFTIGSGTILASSSTTKTISNLLGNVTYDFYVRSNCAANQNSGWVGPIVVNAVGPIQSGDYLPLSIDNKWVYKKDLVLQDPMKVIAVDQINSNDYYKFDNFIGTPSSTSIDLNVWCRKSNGDYFYRAEVIYNPQDLLFGYTIQPFEFIILKDDINVNATWSENYTQITNYNNPDIPSENSEVTINGKIIEKNISILINGITYQDVIKSEVKQTYISTNIVSTYTYWFCRNVGIVKATSTQNNNSIIFEINSYILN